MKEFYLKNGDIVRVNLLYSLSVEEFLRERNIEILEVFEIEKPYISCSGANSTVQVFSYISPILKKEVWAVEDVIVTDDIDYFMYIFENKPSFLDFKEAIQIYDKSMIEDFQK